MTVFARFTTNAGISIQNNSFALPLCAGTIFFFLKKVDITKLPWLEVCAWLSFDLNPQNFI